MKKIILVFTVMLTVFNHMTLMAQEKIKQTAGRDQLGTFAPKFAELNDDVLFGQGRSWATAYISYQMKNVNAAY